MRKVIFKKDYRQYAKGMVYILTGNEAHGVIELGVAKLVSEDTTTEIKKTDIRKRPDKQMRPSKSSFYKTK